MSASGKITLSGLPRGELEALAERLLAENAALRRTIAELRAEVATLKGVKGRPKMKPSGMDEGTEPALTPASTPFAIMRIRRRRPPPAKPLPARRFRISPTS